MDTLTVEIQIQRLLDREPTVQRAVNHMLEKIASSETSDLERFSYWGFLFNAGFYQELISSLVQRLNENQRVHWGFLIEALNLSGLDPSNTVIEATLKGLKRQNANEDLWAAQSFDIHDSRFEEMRRSVADKKSSAERERKEGLLEKFHFLASQRMRDQAVRVLKHMIYLYPDDAHFRELKSGFEEEWARDLISQRFSESHTSGAEVTPRLSGVERELINMWTDAAKSAAAKNPSIAYDLAIALHVMDADEAALEVASVLPTGVGQDWLIAELLLSLRRYVDLLEHLQELETKYASDPETAFAVSYLRAHALKALGQSAAAVEILRNIVQVRPHYRSANHLVLEWSVGVATG